MSAFPHILFGPEQEIQNSYVETVASGNRRFNLGQALFTIDGRRFRFGSAGATLLVASTLVQAAVPTAGHILQTPVAAAVGATSVSTATTTTKVEINEYGEGMLLLTAGNTGENYAYPVDRHGAVAANGVFAVPLVRGSVVQVAIGTTANSASLYRNPFSKVVIAATAVTAPVVGVTVLPLAAYSTSANISYGWMQTRGLAPVRIDATTAVVGQPVIQSGTVAGDAGLATTTLLLTNAIVGNIVAIGSSTHTGLVDLRLE